jgi:carboxypeptidase PM20D1
MLRTTTAPPMLSGSSKENDLPTEAPATVHFRLHPRDTVEGVLAHVVAAVDDPEVEVKIAGDHHSEASPVASTSAQGYLDIENSILAVFGDVIPVPGMTIAATDARHYALAADGAYRISPFQLTDDDLARFHGTDERLSVENLGRGIDFFGALITKQ